ncbi:putative RNA-binding protein [Lachnellula suecica]|uniref:Putative RNA-binding protein n=1 Tax=Lachnellula suecica TaxID=602035 RepID=A0A8T9C689_9HELO|nr:putative RNA-binding protein [Lachnellula suecica]
MFIGGLNWETTDESLKEYFSQFGEVLECTVMRDGASGRSRGFGFLTFKDARTVNIVMVKEHYLDGKIVNTRMFSFTPYTFTSSPSKTRSLHDIQIDPKRAIPRDEQERTSKIFVGGVSQEATEQNFKEFFMKFGRVVDATLMMDKDTGRPRGFGFVTFDSEAAVDACLEQPLEILGKPIEVKKAQPRGNMREEEEARGGARGGRFRKDENQNMNQTPQNGGGNNMAPNGMTPQLMAQYWQRMQTYFAMMQQQMAMGRGMPGMPAGMNPMMMQQMQAMAMQNQMQQGAGGRSQSPQAQSPGMPGMQGMTPQMQQQMMQQMQMQGMGGGAGGPTGPAAGAGSNPGGGVGTPGYNAYEQQVFEQQKYEQQQQQMRGRGQREAYGAGGGGGGYGGGPTSWEGMYDDVPQPNVPSGGGGRGGFGGRGGSNRGSAPPQNGPVSAPPANAPTGPKNAGKPGANYRGGGRGGNRGFHPYARG